MQLDGQASEPSLIDERGDLARSRHRRRNACLVLAPEERHGASELPHAATADLLRRSQRFLGSVRVASQHVPGARHLEHHGRQAVPDEVVDVASDATAFSEHCVLGQLSARALELEHESFLASDRATEHPREDDGHDPDAGRDLHRILDQSHHNRRRGGDQPERRGRLRTSETNARPRKRGEPH